MKMLKYTRRNDTDPAFPCPEGMSPALHRLLAGRGVNSVEEAAAFLGGMAPIGVLFAACLLQHLTDGCAWLARLGLYPGVTDLTPSVFVCFCGLTLFLAEGCIFGGGRRTEGKRKGGRG